jgi:hypothetical protein
MLSNEWVQRQMNGAGLPQTTQTSVHRLIEVWNTMSFRDGDPAAESTIEAFSKLALGHALPVLADADGPARWVSSTIAKPRQGSRVRIRLDGYTGEAGERLNGREGAVARVTYGLLVVSFDGMSGSQHFRPDMLETRVTVEAP